ncbi:MAG: LURP-one-related family protein [Actinobacteria bacterium]|nr:LURP-one-related family protein [Actinomycetota bacterium]
MRYLVRQKMFAIGDDFWVTDEEGNQVFLVDGKAMRLRETLELKDASGAVVATVRKKLLAMRDTMEIERDGAVLATVRKAVFSPLRHRSTIDLADGGQLEAVGNIFDLEFEIRAGGRVLAQVSRAWFRFRDTYGVDVAPGVDAALMIAIAVCLDRIHRDEQQERRG